MTMLTISNVIAWSLQIAAIVAAALLALRVLRVDAPGVRHGLLRGVLLVCLVLPLAQPHVSTEGRAARSYGGMAETSIGLVTATTADGREGLSAVAPRFWPSALVVLLIIGTVGRVLWIGAGILRLRRLRLAGEIAAATGEQEEVQWLLRTRATIRYVAALGQPVTFGFHRPVVLLPESLRAEPPGIQRAVLVHELWHVRRRDWIWTVAEEAVRAVFWWHPAVLALLSRIQSTREELVDELTVLTIGSRRQYLDALLAYAGERPVIAAMAFARRRHLLHRMILISREVVMSSKRVVACSAALVVTVSVSGWYAVAAFPLSQSTASSEVMSDRPGPVEQRAKPITPENPIPQRLHMVPADYPVQAEASGARGTVTVRVTLDESGRTTETRVTGISLVLGDRTGFSFRNRSSAELDRFLESSRTVGTEEQRRSARTIAIGMMEAARRAVNQWVYAAPADGPISFDVHVRFGPQGTGDATSPAPPPPPPPPPPATPAAEPWQMADGAVRVGAGTQAPVKLRNVNPTYPPEALAAKVQGVVIIEARIERDGTVGDARVLRSIPLLDEAALDAVRQWEFTPTLLTNGEPVPVIMTVTVNFTLRR